MKHKIVKSDFDAKTGVSFVTIQTPKGHFTGYSKLRKVDEPFGSRYTGCRYAEIKAIIKSIKVEIKELKNEYRAFDNFYKQLHSSKKNNPENYESYQIRKHICELNSKIRKMEKLKGAVEETLLDSIKRDSEEIKTFRNSILTKND